MDLTNKGNSFRNVTKFNFERLLNSSHLYILCKKTNSNYIKLKSHLQFTKYLQEKAPFRAII